MRIITIEDFRDIYVKIQQRGFKFLTSKFNFREAERTKSSFNDSEIETSNWWIIPEVQKRWNKLITGSEDLEYEKFICQKFFNDGRKMKMLSIGSGVCGHEIKIAELMPNWEIHCFDFSEKLLQQAKNNSDQKNLTNIFYHAEDIYSCDIGKHTYDIVFFHASLHHFNDIPAFFNNVVLKALENKNNGYLIINEYVGKNRLQYSSEQIQGINNAIQILPKKFRKIYKTKIYKNHYYGSGLFRMIISDPSECIDSESIMPEIHKRFNIIIEKSYGGNLLMSTLKDLSHHFVQMDNEKKEVLSKLFETEDLYLKNHQSDFVFGIYQLKND